MHTQQERSQSPPAMETSNPLPQAESETSNDIKAKTPVWKDGEQTKLCELLRARLEVEKVTEERLTCPQLFSLMSNQLSESGIEKTAIQCQTRWYQAVRFEPEFSNAFRFKEAVASKSNTSPLSASQSKVDPDNDYQVSRWDENEVNKLKELVIAYRSSTPHDQQLQGMPLWALISQQLESHNIHRSSQACAKKWRRYSSNQESTTAPAIDLDDCLPLLYDSKSRHDDVDTGYVEEDDEDSESRRGSRQRISRPRWSDEEHDKLVELLKARRELENEDESIQKLSRWKLFLHVSKQLQQSSIDRSASACQHYWNSKGFERSGFNVNSSFNLQPGSGTGKLSPFPSPSSLGKDIEDAFSRLPQQLFDDSLVAKGFSRVSHFVDGTLKESSTGDKRPITARDDKTWEDSDDEPITRAVKRRRSAGDVFGSKGSTETFAAPALGTTPGMMRRLAPKRDPSLPLIKPNACTTTKKDAHLDPIKVMGYRGANFNQNAGHSEGPSAGYDVMKTKIQELQDEISSLRNKKQETRSEIQKGESNILSLQNKIQLLQGQKQKLEQSKRENEAQIDIYSSKIDDLAKKKKTLEDALDIVGGSI